MTRLTWTIVLLLLLVAVGAVLGGARYECDITVEQGCVVRAVSLQTAEQIANVTFPAAGTLALLTLADGHIPDFSPALATKLAAFRDLTIAGMGIRTLAICPLWQHLTASNNSIEALVLGPDGPDFGLRTLYLRNNALTSVPPFGRRFPQLQVLGLEGNRLRELTLDSFAHLEQLQSLSLARNQLFSVTQLGTGVQLRRLRQLSLADNRLLTLNVSGWELASLESLDLSGNELYLVQPGANLSHLRELRELRYAGNDWNCEWLSGLQASLARLVTTDRDAVGRCERLQMRQVRGVCCHEPALQDFSRDLFADKWEQLNELQRRYELVQLAYDRVEEADLDAIEQQAFELRERLAGPTATQEALESDLRRLQATVGVEQARLEQLETTVNRSLADLRESIEALYERRARPQPTLEAVLQESLGESIGRLEKSVERLRWSVRDYVFDTAASEASLLELERRIGAFERLLAEQKQRTEELEKLVEFVDTTGTALYNQFEQHYSREP